MQEILTSLPISTIAVLLGIAVFIVMCMKGSGTIVAGIFATIIVAITASGGFVENLFTSFISGAAGFLQVMFMTFVCGAIFGGLLNATGCADRIGITFAKLLGEKYTFFVIYLLIIMLTMAGVQPIMIVSFISFGLMRQLNLPRYIAMVACMAPITILNSMFFTPTAGNLMATNFFGTTIYTEPLFTIWMALVAMVFTHLYVLHLVKKARADGTGYDPMENETVRTMRNENELPSLACALIPIIFVVVWCFVTIMAFNWNSTRAAISGMLIAAVYLYITCGKYIPGSKFAVVENTVKTMTYALLCSCAAVGFATVVKNTALFQSIIDGISSLNVNGYIVAVVGSAVFAAICADGSGGSSAFMSVMSENLLATGLPAGILHRLTLCASTTIDTLPHAGSIVLFLSVFGYNHKNGYKYLFVSNMIITSAVTIVALVTALIFY